MKKFTLVLLLITGFKVRSEVLLSDLDKRCDENKCKYPYKLINNHSDRDKLLDIAIQLSQIWGDTILESDLQDYGTMTLTKNKLIFLNNKPVARLIKYSKPARDLSTCRQNLNTPIEIENCQTGYIQEGSFLSLNMKSYYIPDGLMAQFFTRQRRK